LLALHADLRDLHSFPTRRSSDLLPPHLRPCPAGRGRPVHGDRDGGGARGPQPRELLHRGAAARGLRAVPRLAPTDGPGPVTARPLLVLLSQPRTVPSPGA